MSAFAEEGSCLKFSGAREVVNAETAQVCWNTVVHWTESCQLIVFALIYAEIDSRMASVQHI